MKKSTKKIITRALSEEIRRLKGFIEACRGKYPVNEPHVLRMHRKIDDLHKAISEVEAC